MASGSAQTKEGALPSFAAHPCYHGGAPPSAVVVDSPTLGTAAPSYVEDSSAAMGFQCNTIVNSVGSAQAVGGVPPLPVALSCHHGGMRPSSVVEEGLIPAFRDCLGGAPPLLAIGSHPNGSTENRSPHSDGTMFSSDSLLGISSSAASSDIHRLLDRCVDDDVQKGTIAGIFKELGIGCIVDVACLAGYEAAIADVITEEFVPRFIASGLDSGRAEEWIRALWSDAQRPAGITLEMKCKSKPSAFATPPSVATPRGSVGAAVVPAPLPVVSRDERLVLSCTASALKILSVDRGPSLTAHTSSNVPSHSATVSAKGDLRVSWEKVLCDCRALLKELGPVSPRFCKLFGADSAAKSLDAALAVQDDIFRDQSSAPQTVANYVKDTKCFFAWLRSISRDVQIIDEFDVATFLRDQVPRGPSVAHRVFRALVWAEKAFGLRLFASHPAVVSQSQVSREAACADVASAAMATTKMLQLMENYISDAPTLPLRIYAGMCCALAHGVLRWRDLIRSENLHLTADALCAVTWLMKSKAKKVPWAALRCGLTNRDWAGRWVKALSKAGLPGEDFILYGISLDFTTLRPRVSSYSDGVNAMRMLLVSSGMEAKVALTFTLHSWRHLFPAAARQLRLPEHGQVEMGHWATGSSMPRRYDSMACVTELVAKSKITQAFGAGWDVAQPGCLPRSVPVSCVEDGTAVSVDPPHKKMKTRVSVSGISVIKEMHQVVHLQSGKVHIWIAGIRTACNTWACGSPTAPADSATFIGKDSAMSDSSTSPLCKSCYSSRLQFLNLGDANEEDVGDEDTRYEFESDSCSDDFGANVAPKVA